MGKLLVVEDNLETQKIIALALKSEEFELFQALSLSEAHDHISKNQFDLVLLDILLPDGNGLDFLSDSNVKEKLGECPVIFITGKGEINDKMAAFSLGAEDYIVKPFHPLELKARIQARMKTKSTSQSHEESFQKGDLFFQIPSQQVFLVNSESEKKNFDLTPIEFKLLYTFSNHEDKILTREQLIQTVWGNAVHILDRTVDTHVSKLRKKIKESQFEIKSVHGVGYRFILNANDPTGKKQAG